MEIIEKDAKQIALNTMSVQLANLGDTVNRVIELVEHGKNNSKIMNGVLSLKIGSDRIVKTFFEIPKTDKGEIKCR